MYFFQKPILIFSYCIRFPMLPYCEKDGTAKTVANLIVNHRDTFVITYISFIIIKNDFKIFIFILGQD